MTFDEYHDPPEPDEPSKAEQALADMRDCLKRVREGRHGPQYDAGVRDGRAERDACCHQMCGKLATRVHELEAELARIRAECAPGEDPIDHIRSLRADCGRKRDEITRLQDELDQPRDSFYPDYPEDT